MLSTSFDSGIDPKIVSDRVGHSNMNVTFQVYTHRSSGKDRAAAEQIAKLIEAEINAQKNPRGDGSQACDLRKRWHRDLEVFDFRHG